MRRPMSGFGSSRAAWLLPLLFLLLTVGSYLDPYLHPTFPGDQGDRLDQANRLIVTVGGRQWLPFLQLHIRALHAAHAPIVLYLAIPLAYTAATLFVLNALCRAAIPAPWSTVAAVFMLGAFTGSSYHWLGRTLYQEVIVLPVFLVLVYVRLFAPTRRWSYLALWGIGMLTREVFWIWWLAAVVVDVRRWREDWTMGMAMLGLASIPLAWLALTNQSPLLSTLAIDFTALGPRASALFGLACAQALVLPLIVLVAQSALVQRAEPPRSAATRWLAAFSAISLALIYMQTLLFDPYSPGNPRSLLPLYAHLLVWIIFAWRRATGATGSRRAAAIALAAIASFSSMKLAAIEPAVVRPRPSTRWEPVQVITQLDGREDWRARLTAALLPLRQRLHRPLEVTFVGIDRGEYLKFWVAPFLYDQRRLVAHGQSQASADVVIDSEPPTAEDNLVRLHLGDGLERSVQLNEVAAPPS